MLPVVNHRGFRALPILWIVVGWLAPVRAEDPVRALGESWPWRVFDRQEGLRSNVVSALHQDRFEYLYAATDQGLCRYDLWEWTDVSNSWSAEDGEVVRFVESFGTLYAVTATSLWKVEGGVSLGLFYRGASIVAASSPQGEVFVIDQGTGGSARGRHLQVRGGRLDELDPEVQLPTGTILDYQVAEDRAHWLATEEGLYSRSPVRRAWRTIPDRELDPALRTLLCTRFFRVQGPAERVGFPDARGWVSQWEELWGLFRDPRGTSKENVLAVLRGGVWTKVTVLEGPPVQGLLSDAGHNYYATTEDGRLFFHASGQGDDAWLWIEDLGIGQVAVHAEILDASGVLWFRLGTGGLAAFDPQSRRWETIPTGSSQRFPNVLSLVETEEGEIWMGMTQGLARYRPGASPETYESALGVPLTKITGLAQDENSNIWVSSVDSFAGAFCFMESIWTRQTIRDHPGFTEYPIRRIVRDRLKETWFLSEERTDAGEYVLYHLSHYTSDQILPVRVPYGPVNDLVRTGATASGSDIFWLATDDGLLKGTVDDSIFRIATRYTEENGLRSRRVFTVAEGPDGSVWVCYPGASGGVTRIKAGEIAQFDVQDGLASPEVWSIAANGRNLWFGTDRGLSRYDGECWYTYPIASRQPRISRVLPVFPSVVEADSVLVGTWGLGTLRFRLDDRRRPRRPRFTRFLLPGQVGPAGNVQFSWDARDFRNDTAPDALLFRSRLDREPWTTFRPVRFRDFRDLSAGAHVFEVEVRDLDGNRNRVELVHRFQVEPRRPTSFLWVIVGGAFLVLVLLMVWKLGPRLRLALRHWQLHREYLRRSPFPFFLIDSRGVVLDSGGDPSSLLGLDVDSRSELDDRPLVSLPPFSDPEVRSAIKRVIAGETVRLQNVRWAADGGTERTFEVRGFPLGGTPNPDDSTGSPTIDSGPPPTDSGDPARGLAVVFLEETTERVDATRLMERARRLSSLRSFAARIVSSLGDLLHDPAMRDFQASHPAMAERLRRLDTIVSRLGVFSGRIGDPGSWRRIEPNDLLEGLIGSTTAARTPDATLRVGSGIRVDFRGQPGLWPTRGDEALLRDALLAVLRNAVESIEETGTLTVRTANLRIDSDPGTLTPGSYVEVQIRDTGPGMDPSQVERIFEPFYSTKSRDEALGIGLSAAHGIVYAHRGELRVVSRLGRGTTVTILLPALRGEAPNSN